MVTHTAVEAYRPNERSNASEKSRSNERSADGCCREALSGALVGNKMIAFKVEKPSQLMVDALLDDKSKRD